MPEKYDLLDLIDSDMHERLSDKQEQDVKIENLSELKNRNPLTLKYKKRLKDAIKTYQQLNKTAA